MRWFQARKAGLQWYGLRTINYLMNKNILLRLLSAAVLLCNGCRPDEGLWWSPDGQVAAVRAPGGLRLANAQGELSPPVLAGEIQSAEWLPDGSALLVSRAYEVDDWDSAEALIPSEEAAAMRQLAGAIPDLLKAVLAASGGSLDDMDNTFLRPLGLVSKGDQLEVVFRCALALHKDRILSALAAFPKADILPETNSIVIHEISILPIQNGKPAGEARALVRSLQTLLDPTVSPRHPLAAYRTGDGALKAIGLDGRNSLMVADDDAQSAVWSDNDLVYVRLVAEESNAFGEIRRRTVISPDGTLFSPDNAPKPETLALAPFDLSSGKTRLRALPNGQILFASVQVQLPARVDLAAEAQFQFFFLDPRKPGNPIVPVTVTDGSLPADLTTFAVSPDGKRVAIVEGGTDAAAVLEFATRKVEIISAPRGRKSRLIPAWRNNEELTFAALPAVGSARSELFLWKSGNQSRKISENWPDEVVKPWLAD